VVTEEALEEAAEEHAFPGPGAQGPPNRHAFAALWNTGDAVLIVRGTARKTPPRPIAMLFAPGSAGGDSVGSGKPETPCARMHSEMASICCFACAERGPRAPGPPPGSSLAHCDWAALNAGENGLMPELELIWIPPPARGSGKFGTPCERMQLANASPEPPAEAAAFDLLDDPQAAIARTQLKHARPIAGRLAIDAVLANDG
jgi:hypothetical protein